MLRVANVQVPCLTPVKVICITGQPGIAAAPELFHSQRSMGKKCTPVTPSGDIA